MGARPDWVYSSASKELPSRIHAAENGTAGNLCLGQQRLYSSEATLPRLQESYQFLELWQVVIHLYYLTGAGVDVVFSVTYEYMPCTAQIRLLALPCTPPPQINIKCNCSRPLYLLVFFLCVEHVSFLDYIILFIFFYFSLCGAITQLLCRKLNYSPQCSRQNVN